MITLKNLKINNFISHKETEISFNDETKVLLDGKSGAGKSSVVEAIIWGLYGVARCPNKDLVLRGEKTSTVAIVLFDNNENIYYEIKRSTTDKAKNTLIISKSENGTDYSPVECNGARETQAWIENDLLHASYTLFVNSIASPQNNNSNFVDQTASKRKDLLLEIANIKDFDLYYSRARELLSLKNEEKARLSTAIEGLSKRINENELAICDEEDLRLTVHKKEIEKTKYTTQLELLIAEKSKLGDFSADINRIKAYITDARYNINTVNAKTKTCFDKITNIKTVVLPSIEPLRNKISAMDTIKERGDFLRNKAYLESERSSKLLAVMADKPQDRDYDGEIMDLNKRLIPLIKETGTCPSGDACPFVQPIKSQIKYLEDQIGEKTQKSSELEKAKANYSSKILALGPSLVTEEERIELRDITSKLSSSNSDVAELAKLELMVSSLPGLELELTQLNNDGDKIIKEISNLELELSQKEEAQKGVDTTIFDLRDKELRSNISSISTDISLVLYKIESSIKAKEKIEEITKEMSQLVKKEFEVELTIENISIVKDAFGSKGIKTVAIDYLIPRLEDKINEILSKLSEFRVRLDTQKGSSDGENVIEGLFINIINDRGEQLEYSSYSGGERLKISVSINEALASLQKCGFRIFDELFVGLDEDSVQHFADVMDQLQSKFKQIMCISHLRTIKDLFDEKINIIKINGVSKIS